MSYPQCRTCKWWDPIEWDIDLSKPYSGWGECDYSYHIGTKMEAKNNAMGVVTLPDFGCNQHEPREKRWQLVRAPNWDEDTVTIDLDKMFGRQGG